jgi:hypothetical protein
MLRKYLNVGLIGVAIAGLGCTGAVGDGGRKFPPGNNGSGSGSNGSGTGSNGSGSGSNGSGSSSPGSSNGSAMLPPNLPNDSATVPGAAPLRRLTRLEYDNTIKDLLGVASTSTSKLTADQGSYDSGFVMGGSITGSTDARGVYTNAEEIANLALKDPGKLLPCSPVPSDRAAQDSCADKFVESFGLRAFRRPLSMDELNDLKGLYRANREAALGATFEQSIAAVITAVLQTPQFLYHWEVAAEGSAKDGELLRLGPYELASKLSYLFWSSMPDDNLFAAAKDGHLNTADDAAREARRLLNDDRAKAGLQDFFLQWLELGNLGDMPKDPMLYSQYSPELAASMTQEAREFVNGLFFGGKATGSLEGLLTSNKSFIDAGLAKLYGVNNVTGSGMQPADLDAAKRAGIFTQAGFLTAKADADASHPVKRGDAVLRRLLCTELILPADLMVPTLPEPKPGQTTRERYSTHSASPCATCHKIIDPVGFSFEHYDGIGAYRTMEEGKMVDATGSVTLGSGEVKFDGAVEMMKILAKSTEARDCMAQQWLRYSLRRRELQTEAPSVKLLEAALGAGGDLRDLMVAATKARTFTHRAPSPGEVSP